MAIDPLTLKQIGADIDSLVVLFQDRHVSAFYAANALLGLAFLASFCVVIAGIYNRARLAAILGIVTTTLISVDRAWVPAEKAQFWREVQAMAKNVQTDLRLAGGDERKLNTYSATALARGTGMAEIQKLSTALAASSASDPPKAPGGSTP